ncbi:MAG: metallophosphoesterase [Chloroflexota bacterium]
MNLYAISDLHLGHKANREALATIGNYPEDWLIIAGDIGETDAHLIHALNKLNNHFKQLIWVPGNHDLWTMPTPKTQDASNTISTKSPRKSLRGDAKYRQVVEICRYFNVLTPEDPYMLWPGTKNMAPENMAPENIAPENMAPETLDPTSGIAAETQHYLLVPTFSLYDYSFSPPHITNAKEALDWAAETDVVCADEVVLHPDPYASRSEWCAARCAYTEQRIDEALAAHQDVSNLKLILINHYPLREELINLRRIPRFSVWCGTKRTEDWHKRYPIAVAISGHLHMRSTKIIDNVRFEEVSLGYPQHWQRERGIDAYLRKIL